MGVLILSCSVSLRTRIFCVADMRYTCDTEDVKNPWALSLSRNCWHEVFYFSIPICRKGLETMINSVSMNTSAAYIFLLFCHLYLKIPLPTERNHSLERWLILGRGRKCIRWAWNNLAKKPADTIRVMPKGLRSLILMAKDGTVWALIRII